MQDLACDVSRPCDCGGCEPQPCGRPAVEVVSLAGGALRIPRCAEHSHHLRDALLRLGLLRDVEATGRAR